MYKSHLFDNPKVDPSRIVHIYRHPLDVFLSSINFNANNSAKHSDEHKQKIFLNSEPKLVDELSTRELDWYLDEFIDTQGVNWWGKTVGNLGYFDYVAQLLRSSKSLNFKYEDLFSDFEGNVKAILYYAFKGVLGYDEIEQVEVSRQRIDSRTRFSSSPFFWKAKPANYFDYLTAEQIMRFENSFEAELKELGYLGKMKGE